METLEATLVMDPHRIDTELEKANVTRAIIHKLRTTAAPLVGTPIETKEQYDLVHAAEMACVKVRNTAIAICKKERDPAIAYQKAVIAKEKEVVAEIEEIERPLKQLKADFNAIEQRRFEEAAQAFAAKVRNRKERLYQVGFRFDGTKYVLPGFAELTEEDVSGLGVDDLQLGEWLNGIERDVKEHQEREAEKERTAKIAAEALAAQQKAEADRIAAVAAEQERKASELAAKEAAMNAKILSARHAELRAVGAVTPMPDSELLAMDDEEFDSYVGQARAAALAHAKAAKEAEEKATAERIANELRIAKEAVEKANAERIAAEQRAAEEAAEKEAKQSDAAKLRSYQAALLAVKQPEMKSKAGKDFIVKVTAYLDTMLKK